MSSKRANLHLSDVCELNPSLFSDVCYQYCRKARWASDALTQEQVFSLPCIIFTCRGHHKLSNRGNMLLTWVWSSGKLIWWHCKSYEAVIWWCMNVVFSHPDCCMQNVLLLQFMFPDPPCSSDWGHIQLSVCVLPLLSILLIFLSAVHKRLLSKNTPRCPVWWTVLSSSLFLGPWASSFWLASPALHRTGALCWWSGGRAFASRMQLGSRLSPVVSSKKMFLSVGLRTSFSLWIPSVFGAPTTGPNEVSR